MKFVCSNLLNHICRFAIAIDERFTSWGYRYSFKKENGKMRKLVISLIFTMVLTACGGGKSSSESEANKSNGAVDQNANTSSIGVSGINLERDGKVEAPFIVVTNISFSPTSGKLSKSKSSLRGKVTFEYDTDHFKNGSGLNDIFFAYIVIEGKGGLRLVSDNPAGKIDLHNGKGGALVSFSISEAWII